MTSTDYYVTVTRIRDDRVIVTHGPMSQWRAEKVLATVGTANEKHSRYSARIVEKEVEDGDEG